jgi:ABC-type transporter Mla maintaining outer membrane lipid asymmetry ATPase subunit MlaF
LEFLELTPWADSTPGTLSRNWQRRAGLARALILGPDLLLLDNPLMGLDLLHRQWWLAFLDQLSNGHTLFQGRPVTLAVTTADLRPWYGHARQFAALRNRRFIAFGDWMRLTTSGDEWLRELLAEEQAKAKV